jgi:hypothetical protein
MTVVNAANGWDARRQPERRRRRRGPRALVAALVLLLLAAAAGCGKPGDQGGGTTRERSMASPAASTPTPSRPEAMPGSDAARTAPSGR